MKRFIPLLMLAVWAYVAKPDGKGYVVTKDGKPEFETASAGAAQKFVSDMHRQEEANKRRYKKTKSKPGI